MIKLQPGDYVLTSCIENVEQLFEIVDRFKESGAVNTFDCEKSELVNAWVNEEIIGWDERDDQIYFGDDDTHYRTNVFTGRRLKPSEILGEDTVKWDGEGLPPVGTECEAVAKDGEWYTVKIVMHNVSQHVAVFECPTSSGLSYYWQTEDKFRPIRSEEVKTIDEMANIMFDCDAAGNISAKEAAKALYKAGYRKMENN